MQLAAYLDRIGLPASTADRPMRVAALRAVASAHAARVPFENTRAHRGERISIRIEDILERLVARREGGVCYELNGGLAWLLAELGADVEINAAQVLPDQPAAGTAAKEAGAGGAGGLPMSHMTLIVTLADGDRRLVDVGFGGETILREVPDDGEVVTTDRGSSYRIDRRPRQLADFEALAWWHSTSPGSRFMRSIIISSTRPDGVVTLFGRGEPDDGIAWFHRPVDATAPGPVSTAAAADIAARDFELTAPLPQRIIRYGPVG